MSEPVLLTTAPERCDCLFGVLHQPGTASPSGCAWIFCSNRLFLPPQPNKRIPLSSAPGTTSSLWAPGLGWAGQHNCLTHQAARAVSSGPDVCNSHLVPRLRRALRANTEPWRRLGAGNGGIHGISRWLWGRRPPRLF